MPSNSSEENQVARAELDKIKRILSNGRSSNDTGVFEPNSIQSLERSSAREEVFTGTIEDLVGSIEAAVHRSSEGHEFWSARALMRLLGYSSDSWEEFSAVIIKAQYACERSDQRIESHFHNLKDLGHPDHASEDVNVSRYGAYLIAQNGDSRKRQVAFAQTYFAAQTRKQQLNERETRESGDERRRILMRDKVAEHNKFLADAARDAGIDNGGDFARFQNYGYKGLYNGLDVTGIRNSKNLPAGAKILDHMDITELAANFFRATQAEDKLRREKIQGKDQANAAHFEVGQKVRKAIRDIGGTMPEKLPAAEDISHVRKRVARLEGQS